MIPIEVAIFVNMAVPYIKGELMIFMGYIIVSCIQLGATVDYAILTTNNYLECRKEAEKGEAAILALKRSIPAILTSGSILTIVGYILYYISSIAAIGDMGHLIGRGAWMSMLLVGSLMPAFLVLFDRILMENEFERIHNFFKERRRRRLERLKRAARKLKEAGAHPHRKNAEAGRAGAEAAAGRIGGMEETGQRAGTDSIDKTDHTDQTETDREAFRQ